MDTIQTELNLNLIHPDLLKIQYRYLDNQYYADIIHAIHYTTYQSAKQLKLPLTLSLIYRGTLDSDDHEISLENPLGYYCKLEEDEAKIKAVNHTRCTSLKPHACENYDFNQSRYMKVVLGRGMIEQGVKLICAVPTVLFTIHSVSFTRYHASFDTDELAIIGPDQLKDFFWLYEPELRLRKTNQISSY